jgi:hypothetical protein
MNYKEELILLFKKFWFIKKEYLANNINMDAHNFRRYVTDNSVNVSEKTYNKIMKSLEIAYKDFSDALKKEN